MIMYELYDQYVSMIPPEAYVKPTEGGRTDSIVPHWALGRHMKRTSKLVNKDLYYTYRQADAT